MVMFFRALASSAPIWLFGDLVPCDRYNQIVTEDFNLSGPNCVENIRKSWKVVTEMGKTGRDLTVIITSSTYVSDGWKCVN